MLFVTWYFVLTHDVLVLHSSATSVVDTCGAVLARICPVWFFLHAVQFVARISLGCFVLLSACPWGGGERVGRGSEPSLSCWLRSVYQVLESALVVEHYSSTMLLWLDIALAVQLSV
jgi:hypothetical protein